jgi:hypothetical protein
LGSLDHLTSIMLVYKRLTVHYYERKSNRFYRAVAKALIGHPEMSVTHSRI